MCINEPVNILLKLYVYISKIPTYNNSYFKINNVHVDITGNDLVLVCCCSKYKLVWSLINYKLLQLLDI